MCQMIYIKPPRGDILLHDLHECVTTRIGYFLHRYQQDETVPRDSLKCEYLAIGTAFDRVGHFILRLLSAQSISLKEFVASSEATFTIERVEFLSSNQILQLIKTTLRHVDEVCNYNEIVWKDEIKYILSKLKSTFKCSHMVDFNHDEACTEYSLEVPFQMCLSLVAKRELPLKSGKVVVYCGKWKSFLKCLLEAHTKKEIERLDSKGFVAELMSDQRLQDLKNIVLQKILKRSANKDNVNADQLSKLKKLFPPCMGYLYNNLTTNHRLSHGARFNFSLFLKDIGLSVNESIVFWQNEYSKPSRCGKCSHSWQKNSAKYTYSIRHLYGLEGRRANYCTPSCSKIQNNTLGPSDEGGCPFLNFDLHRLKNFLDPKIVQNKEDWDTLMQLRTSNQTQAACHYYRRALVRASGGETTTEHSSPVEYFVILNKQLRG